MAKTPKERRARAKNVVEQRHEELKTEAQGMEDILPSAPPGSYIKSWKVLCLILLMPLMSTAIQLPLTPSHGSIPSMEYHQIMFQSCLLVYFCWRMLYTGRELVTLQTQAAIIPVLAAWTPFIELRLAPTARFLGPAYSAALIKGVTLIPLQGLLLNVIRTSIERSMPRSEFYIGFWALGLYFALDHAWTRYQGYVLALAYGFVRPYMMLLVSLALMALLPTRFLTWAIIPSLHTAFWNPHSPVSLPTRRMNELLEPQGFSVLARTEGITGYLSVLENHKEGYRMLRCDHSVLGGNWLHGLGSWPGGKGTTWPTGQVPESIYAVFVMLEAVRLIEDKGFSTKSRKADSQARALNIGLGIGTTPSAFIAHGIDTTVVELDPAVHRLATQYFGLPRNHTAVLKDALLFVNEQLEAQQLEKYDYIVHDVFTGGAEPTALFTHELISSLSKLLQDDGVIAINYAGDLNLPSSTLVLNTIISVFSNCRLFRDVPEEEGTKHVNFVNMVVFCKKTSQPFVFRKPVEKDYLGTSTRKQYLLPILEIDLETFVGKDSKGQFVSNDSLVLHAGSTSELEKWHPLAARRHWEVIRTVVPDQVWELW